jgi:allophycocyanin alpha subunit
LGITKMKEVASGMMSADDAAEASAYFDYVVGAMQ